MRGFGCPVIVVSLLVGLAGAAASADETPIAVSQQEAQRLIDELVPQVEKLRGLPFKRPVPVEVVDGAAMRDYVLARVRLFDHEGHLDAVQRAYRLLGLIPEDAGLLELLMDAMEEQAGGFYDPSKGAYYLLNDVPQTAAPIFTAHELTHALEDQHFDLDRRLRDTLEDDDRMLAISAVHEGSATILMSVYMMGAVRRGEMDADALQTLAESEAGRAAKLRALPEVLLRQMLGPYVLGALFLGGDDSRGVAGGYPGDTVNRVMSAGPSSSEQILHPEKFWDSEQRDEPREVRLAGMQRVLGKRWTREGHGVLGELTLGALVGAATPLEPGASGIPDAAAWTNQAASGWGGDRWELWEQDGESILLLRVDWDSPTDAAEFAAALQDHDGLRWETSDDRVAIVAGHAGKKTGRLLTRMLR